MVCQIRKVFMGQVWIWWCGWEFCYCLELYPVWSLCCTPYVLLTTTQSLTPNCYLLYFFGRISMKTDSCKVSSCYLIVYNYVTSLFIMKIKSIIIFRSSSVIGKSRFQTEMPDDLVVDFRKKISAGTALSSVSCLCTRLSLTPGCHFKE